MNQGPWNDTRGTVSCSKDIKWMNKRTVGLVSVVGWTVAPRTVCPPRTCDHELIWKKGSLKMKLRILRWEHLTILRWALSTMTCKRQNKGTNTEEMQRWSQRLELVSHKPRNSWSHQEPEEARNGLSLEPLQGARPMALWFWTPGLYDDEKIHFCHFKSLG